MLYLLVTAKYPHFLVTPNKELYSAPDVTVRVGEPRTISEFQTHHTFELITMDFRPSGRLVGFVCGNVSRANLTMRCIGL